MVQGIKAMHRAVRKDWRTHSGMGISRTSFNRQDLSAYTWLRCNRHLQNSWLHALQTADSPAYPCRHPLQDGDHIFSCPILDKQRTPKKNGYVGHITTQSNVLVWRGSYISRSNQPTVQPVLLRQDTCYAVRQVYAVRREILNSIDETPTKDMIPQLDT